MRRLSEPHHPTLGRALKPAVHAVLGAVAVAALRGVRRFDPLKTANFGARTAR